MLITFNLINHVRVDLFKIEDTFWEKNNIIKKKKKKKATMIRYSHKHPYGLLIGRLTIVVLEREVMKV
jgi:hypothetical protein